MSKLVAKGAEASLFLEDWYGHQVIRKHRIPKPYRIPQLDTKLRSERTIREARSLALARRAGVATPIIFHVNPDVATIRMEYIDGPRIKELLPTLSVKDCETLFKKIGEAVARLHKHQLTHGDLTTSNLLLHSQELVYFIDFGLATITQNTEEFGTDLHLLRRALRSTHYSIWETCYTAFKKGYKSTYGKGASAIFRKVSAIESRGRYITERIR
jgi:Kae1-associated kinase Bud32